MQVSEVMSTDPDVLVSGTPLRELETRLMSHHVGGFPVVDGGKLVGMVTRSDLVRILEVEHTIDDQLSDPALGAPGSSDEDARSRGARIGARLEAMTVADVMVHDVSSVSPEASVAEAAETMVERGIHRLPVVDGERLVGIVTSLDLARLVADGY